MTTATTAEILTRPAPFGKDVIDAEGRLLSHVLGAGVDQGAAPLRSETLGDNLVAQIERFPDREAIVDVFADVRLTYREFGDKVDRLAAALLRCGLHRGDRVGIWSTNRWEWPIVSYACHRLGLILVNINPAYRQSELNYVLEKAGVTCVFAARRYKDSDYRTMLIEASKQRGVDLREVIYFGSEQWKEILGRDVNGDRSDLDAAIAEVEATDPVNIQFTSGTTGFPTGATRTHRNLLNNANQTATLLAYDENDRVVVPIPFFHTFGMVLGIIATLSRGAALIIAGPVFQARDVLKAVHSEKATSLYGVPTMFIT